MLSHISIACTLPETCEVLSVHSFTGVLSVEHQLPRKHKFGKNTSSQKTEREPAECPSISLKHFTVHSYADRAFLAPSDESGRNMDILGFCELRFTGSLDPTGALFFGRTRSTESSSDSQQTRLHCLFIPQSVQSWAFATLNSEPNACSGTGRS